MHGVIACSRLAWGSWSGSAPRADTVDRKSERRTLERDRNSTMTTVSRFASQSAWVRGRRTHGARHPSVRPISSTWETGYRGRNGRALGALWERNDPTVRARRHFCAGRCHGSARDPAATIRGRRYLQRPTRGAATGDGDGQGSCLFRSDAVRQAGLVKPPVR